MHPSHSFQPTHLILGSTSPRRQALLREMGLKFECLAPNTDEDYPDHLTSYHITDYLCSSKADSLQSNIDASTLLLCADTIVWSEGRVLEKPLDLADARRTLKALSGRSHQVITSVCFRTRHENRVLHETTEVEFASLEADLIDTYLQNGNPLDKAGAYGIQEWIGLVGVERIWGSYTNVVGLPTRLVYKTLRDMVGSAI